VGAKSAARVDSEHECVCTTPALCRRKALAALQAAAEEEELETGWQQVARMIEEGMAVVEEAKAEREEGDAAMTDMAVSKAGGSVAPDSCDGNDGGAAAVTRAKAKAMVLLTALRESVASLQTARTARAACARTSAEFRRNAEHTLQKMSERVLLLQSQIDENRAEVGAACLRKEPMVEVQRLSTVGCTIEVELREAEGVLGTTTKLLEQLFPASRGDGLSVKV
jgi:hypothetical protein